MNDVDDDIVREFLEESRDNLDQLDGDLIALEGRPTDPDLLAQVFRTIHTIKGTCGFLGYQKLEGLTHAGENLLAALRDGDLTLDQGITSSLLRLVDAVRGVLGRIELTGTDDGYDFGALIGALGRHLATEAPVAEALRTTSATESPIEPAETTVRIDVAVLDKLMDLVGELVLTRTQIGELTDEDEESPLSAPYRQLRLVTSELRDGVMRARLQPIGVVTGKVRRVVRDLAADLGKQIRVNIEGEGVGVDKAVNEVLRDPLLHLVRNAVDHGIEMPDVRVRAGKPAEGVVAIRAFHEAGRVHLELSDDGHGIDADRLVASAIASGALTQAEAALLTVEEARALMFRAGLSTKDDVTRLSGRGVGMDVVHSALHQVGGTIHVTSELGRGTQMRISLPLTLAIVPTLIVRSGGARYLVPQGDVQEIVQLEHEITGAAFPLRDRIVPLVHLADCLAGPAAQHQAGRWVVVVQVDGKRFGVVVDGIDDTAETIVKPLTAALRSIPVFAGLAILSDGEPALVLDVAAVAESLAPAADTATEHRVVVGAEAANLLIVLNAAGGRFAIPLATVRRLEQIPAASIDRSGGTAVVQHLGGSVPLIDLFGSLDEVTVQVVLCDSSMGLVGLVVHRVDDIAVALTSVEPAAILVDLEGLVATSGLGKSA